AIYEVYEDSKQEYQEIKEWIETLTTQRIGQLIEKDEGVTIFNTTGFNRDDVVLFPVVKSSSLRDSKGNIFPVQKLDEGGVAYVKNLPAKGFKSLQWYDQTCEENDFTIDDDGIDTPFYKVVIDQNG